MANRNPVHQEWSFEAQWTWTTGGGGGGSTGDVPSGPREEVLVVDSSTSSTSPQNSPCPTVTRVFRDGASEIQMEYSWQPPNGRHQNSSASGESTTSTHPRHRNAHQHQRPKSCHLDSTSPSATGKLKSDIHRTKEEGGSGTFRPSTLDDSTLGSHGTRGSNGRWSQSSHVGDSGYGSSELSSPMQYKSPPHLLETPVDSERQTRGKPTNGRSRSSYDITLVGNSGSTWSEPRQQPVFHGPNCECIVCHDMQVRFESCPSLGGSKHHRSLETARETMNSPRPRVPVAKGEPLTKGCAVSGPGYLYVPPRADTVPISSPNTSGRRSPAVTSLLPPMYQTHFCTHVPGIRRILSYVPSESATPMSCASDPDRDAIRLEVVDDAYLQALQKKVEMSKTPREMWSGSTETKQKIGESVTTDRQKEESPPLTRRRPQKTDTHGTKEEKQRFRYSYPASAPSPSKSKPRIIHIDVYCTEDDEEEEEEESGQGPQLGDDKSQSDEVHQRTPWVGARETAGSCDERRKSWGGQRTSSQYDSDQRSELDAKTAMFGGAVGNVKKPGRHVGPTRNKNCSCDSCQRYYGGASTACPSTSDSSTTKGLFRPGDHVGKP